MDGGDIDSGDRLLSRRDVVAAGELQAGGGMVAAPAALMLSGEGLRF
jgi:hypothetical protein